MKNNEPPNYQSFDGAKVLLFANMAKLFDGQLQKCKWLIFNRLAIFANGQNDWLWSKRLVNS